MHGISLGPPPMKYMTLVQMYLMAAGVQLSQRMRFINQPHNLDCKQDIVEQCKSNISGIRRVRIACLLH
jgi:hypothetical protein